MALKESCGKVAVSPSPPRDNGKKVKFGKFILLPLFQSLFYLYESLPGAATSFRGLTPGYDPAALTEPFVLSALNVPDSDIHPE